jgi:hypothetical protein
VLVAGEVAGTWRRAQRKVTIEPWRRLTSAERESLAAEAEHLPTPGVEGRIALRWED